MVVSKLEPLRYNFLLNSVPGILIFLFIFFLIYMFFGLKY